MLDVGAKLLAQVKNEVQTCDRFRAREDEGCNRCIAACPAAKESYVSSNIQELNDASVGKVTPAGAIREFGLSCMQTAKCVAPCPVSLNRDLMMLGLKHHIRPLPYYYQRFNLIRGTNLSMKGKLGQKAYNAKQRSKLGTLNRWNEKRPFAYHETLFYFGCYINSPQVCHDTLTLAEALGEKYTVLGGMSTCCGWPQFLQGQFDLASQYMENLRRDISVVSPKQVITSCMECMAALEMVRQDHDLGFEVLSSSEWLGEELDRLDLVDPDEKVILHDSCHRCIKTGDCITAPGVLSKILKDPITQLERFNPAGARSLCCGKYNFGHTPEHNTRLHQTKFDQAEQERAKVMVCECLTCAETFALDAPPGLEVIDMTSYVARQLRSNDMTGGF